MSDPSLPAGAGVCTYHLVWRSDLPSSGGSLCSLNHGLSLWNRPSVSKGVYVSLLSLFGYLYLRRPLSPSTHPGLGDLHLPRRSRGGRKEGCLEVAALARSLLSQSPLLERGRLGVQRSWLSTQRCHIVVADHAQRP